MIERLALVLILVVTAVAVYYALRLWHMRRMQPVVVAERPTLLYFCSDTCAVCPAQGRIVDQVAARWDGRLRVERVNAEQEPETAARYRVFTVPTTILIDGRGRVRQVNYGLTDAHKLGRQLDALGEWAVDDEQPAIGDDTSYRGLSSVVRRPPAAEPTQ